MLIKNHSEFDDEPKFQWVVLQGLQHYFPNAILMLVSYRLCVAHYDSSSFMLEPRHLRRAFSSDRRTYRESAHT